MSCARLVIPTFEGPARQKHSTDIGAGEHPFSSVLSALFNEVRGRKRKERSVSTSATGRGIPLNAS